MTTTCFHPRISRRTALQAGSIGLLGLGMNHLAGLRAWAAENGATAAPPRAKGVIYIFLSGGLAQHDSFDPKPDAGEFGRTPKIFTFDGAKSKLPGRDHWGAVQTVFFAGGGIKGGAVVGESDRLGAYPKSDPQKPENMAATIYHSLGLAPTITWKDSLNRPHQVYYGDPIGGLLS